ncbi:flagellar basal body P-ring formation chaperone FlgA [Frigoriglobus tundricola]|uniref:Flagella basal body P-ring formation protein FlgA SAF domain-containing protein n=1 Tax=Frigoriglobus tundricola TaxID=2774151 RepID=A0A6M5YWX1_9BACT|nr:flagellar basal body P-ring formation chaperone FlgA [Frigoriglobus tundricola]QJW98000.1 hypothetical protein FTUN_5580 [Frigoriglobus tundricola]
MRPLRLLFLAAGLVAPGAGARAADPVTIDLTPTAVVGRSIVTVGDVALISGGDAARDRVARTDVAELKARDAGTVVGRRAVEYRLLLAGFEPGAVRVTGAERAAVTAARRTVTVEEVATAVRAELGRQLPGGADAAVIELALPIVVKLPEVFADERLTITARPHGRPPVAGRVQMDTNIFANGEPLLALPVHLNLRPAGAAPPAGVTGAPGAWPPAPAGAPGADPNAILIQPRQRVEMLANGGGFKVTAIGEAQQAGRIGQTIPVQNVDSKRTVYARVTGPGTVEVDIGGAP